MISKSFSLSSLSESTQKALMQELSIPDSSHIVVSYHTHSPKPISFKLDKSKIEHIIEAYFRSNYGKLNYCDCRIVWAVDAGKVEYGVVCPDQVGCRVDFVDSVEEGKK